MDQDNSFSVMHKNQACMGIICFGVYTILLVMTYNRGGVAAPGGFFFWTRFENLVAKRWKINDRVVPILSVAIRHWNDVICLSRSEKVASVLLLAV